jgi:hypothetical protein
VRTLFPFPETVDHHAARLVAAGVVTMVVLTLATRQFWLLVPLCYGFVARVASGPRFSPLALVVTRVIVPRAGWAPQPTPGPPKRFAQAMGVVFSGAAGVLVLAGQPTAAMVVLALLLAAALAESVLGYCLGCAVFARLMQLGVIPDTVCEACADISRSVARPVRAD